MSNDGTFKTGRRGFLGAAVGTLGAGLVAGCSKRLPRYLVPHVIPPDDAVPGLDFDRRPDAALLACRELDDASSLPASTARRLAEARTGKRLGNPIKAVGCRHSRAKTMTQSHRLSL